MDDPFLEIGTLFSLSRRCNSLQKYTQYYKLSMVLSLFKSPPLTKCPRFGLKGPYGRGGGRGNGRVVTLSPPTSEIRVRFPARPQVRKLVVSCCWSAVYNADYRTLTNSMQWFPLPIKLPAVM